MKQAAYEALVRDVRACTACVGLAPTQSREPQPRALRNVIAGNERLHAKGLGYWSDELGALDADVMVVAQDPGSESYFLKAGPSAGAPGRPRWCDPSHPEKDFTWHNMTSYLAANGIPLDRCFATNAVLCARSTEGSSGTAHGVWFKNCRGFLARQIELVSPKVIASLGEWSTDAVFSALGERMPTGRFRDLVEGPPIRVGDRHVVPLYHPAARPKDRTRDQQVADYARLAAALRLAG